MQPIFDLNLGQSYVNFTKVPNKYIFIFISSYFLEITIMSPLQGHYLYMYRIAQGLAPVLWYIALSGHCPTPTGSNTPA